MHVFLLPGTGHLYQKSPSFLHVCNTHYLAVHWNFHCSSWTGCHRPDWLAQWIDLFFLLASWPLHNSMLVLLKSKSESLTFLQRFSSQLFRPTDWDDLISNLGLHLISEITLLAFLLQQHKLIGHLTFFLDHLSEQMPLMWNVNLCHFCILYCASVGQNVKTILDVRSLTMKKRSTLYFVVILVRNMN